VTAYGYAVGHARLKRKGEAAEWAVRPGMYFACPGPVTVTGDDVLLVLRDGFGGLFAVGGPLEERGRLKYIDGCSDTLLIGPPKKGDPCLNHLHFPPGVRQTMHTHPTARVGVVASGSGRCVTPEGERPLTPGTFWYLPAGAAHCFYTDGGPMDVVAWHPDSDTGPDDDDHPMVNRTMVGGVSAAGLADIRTREIGPG